jgi:DNA-binding transcriptional MerR regulator
VKGAEAEIPDRMFFRIGDAAQLIGVEPHVLRYWETEFKIRPQRSSTGQRMYRRKDIAKFLQIKRLLHDEGFTIAGARKALAEPGEGPAPAAGADTARVQEALGRIDELRRKIGEARTRVASVGVAPDRQPS